MGRLSGVAQGAKSRVVLVLASRLQDFWWSGQQWSGQSLG